MKNIDKHLEFFKRATNNDLAGEYVIKKGILPYVRTNVEVSEFLTDFYDSTLLYQDYLTIMEGVSDLSVFNETTDIDTLKGAITYIVRSDRFREGFLLKQIKNGNMYLLLKNIKYKIIYCD